MSYAVVKRFFEKSFKKYQLFCDFQKNTTQDIANVARPTTKNKIKKCHSKIWEIAPKKAWNEWRSVAWGNVRCKNSRYCNDFAEKVQERCKSPVFGVPGVGKLRRSHASTFFSAEKVSGAPFSWISRLTCFFRWWACTVDSLLQKRKCVFFFRQNTTWSARGRFVSWELDRARHTWEERRRKEK